MDQVKAIHKTNRNELENYGRMLILSGNSTMQIKVKFHFYSLLHKYFTRMVPMTTEGKEQSLYSLLERGNLVV